MSSVLPNLYLARHGDTAWTDSHRHTGRTDLPLNEGGEDRARQLGRVLEPIPFVRVFTSPLRRVARTCALAGFGEVAEVAPDLHEWDYGEYEGLTTPQIREQRPDWNLWRDGCPGGEGPEQVGSRADHVIGMLRDSDGDCVVFAHGHILRVIAARWLEQPVGLGARLALSTGTLSTLGFERETQVIREWNRVP